MRTRLWGTTVLILAFIATRLLWAQTLMPFRAQSIRYFSQLLDPPLLQNRLAESLWYLHAQPPLWNLVTGLALKVAPDAPGTMLQPLWQAAGLVTCLSVASVLHDLRFPFQVAAVVALAVVSTPTFLIYEHWYFYPHAATALIAATGALLLHSKAQPNRWLALGMVSLGALALLRSLFHPVYVVAVAALVVRFAEPAARRRVAAMSAIALAPVLLVVVKNAILFGVAGTSSWAGCSFHRMFTESIPAPEIQALVDAGELTPISTHWEFSKPEVYLDLLHVEHGDTGIPALDTTAKTQTRENPVNYNHWIYPYASREYSRNARHLLRTRFPSYLRSVRWTAHRFLDPLTDDVFLRPLRFRVRRWVEPFEAAQRSPLLWLLAGIAIVVSSVGPGTRGTMEPSERMFRLFVLGTILWVAAVGIALEYGENNRFRYQLGPLLWIAATVSIRDLARLVRERLPLPRR